MSLTQANLNQLQERIDAGDRAGFYILYHNLTGSEQALTQAQVSSYSGGIGQLALFSNAAAKWYLGDRYSETTDQFSLSIASDLNNKIRDNVNNGGSGTFTDDEILRFAKTQWDNRGIGEYFPGNVLMHDNVNQLVVGGIVVFLGAAATAGNEGASAEDPSLIYGPFNRPLDVPQGGQQIMSPDGRVSYIVDASGKTVYGSVVINNGPAPSFTFTNTIQGDQINVAFTDQGANGATSMTSTFDTSIVDGVRVVTGQTTTVMTESGLLKYVAGSSGDSTLIVGNTALAFHDGEFVRATPQGNAIDVVQQQTTGTKTTTVDWEGETERITKLNNDLSSSFQQFDPNKAHPYDKLEVTEGPDNKVTTAQVTLDPAVLAAGMSIGQIFGSALGGALGGNSLVGNLAGNTIGGLIGQKFIQVLATSMTADLSQISLSDVVLAPGINVANAGIGAVSSFLTAELGRALGINGFGGQLFNTAVSGFTTSMLIQVTDKMTSSGLTFAGAIAAMDWSQAVTGAIDVAEINLGNLLGSYLGHELVPAQTREGEIGGQLFGAIGSFILPGGLGSLIGTILGTWIGNHFGTQPSPAAVDLLDQAGYFYGHSEYQSSDGGGYEISDRMAQAADDIVNAYLHAVDGAALDHSKQVTLGYIKNPDLLFITGGSGHTEHSFTSADDAVHAAALDVLQNLEVIGGDLLMKRAHQNSPSNTPEAGPAGGGMPGQSQVSGADQLATMAGDLSVAQDYENYLNNREAINALIAANPNSAFAMGWIATFARVNDLGLNHMSASDFLGGLVGYLDSVNKAGLGAEAANATVSRGAGNTVVVEIKIPNSTEVPGALSVFSDHINVTSGASGQTLQFTVDSGIVASGEHFLPAGASAGDGANDLWIGAAGTGNTFTGTGGHDILVGGAANDVIYGGGGFDFIDGGAGVDYLYGQDGNDILRGGAGIDFLYGGQGDDTYVFNRGDGVDTVLDDVTFTTTTSGWHDWHEDQDGTNIFHHDWVTTTTTNHPDAGRDSLVFGPGIAWSDIAVRQSGNDLIVGVKDPAHPGVPFDQLTDKITLQHWFDDAKDRIENFVFADGTTLDLSAGQSALAPYEVPFGETLSRTSVAENTAIGTVVGMVSTFDLDPNAILTYSLVDYGYGRFAINASTGVITVAGALNFEGTPAWPLTVHVTDRSGHVFDKPVTINVTDVNETPTDITLSGGSVAENSANGMLVGTVTGTDPDAGASLHYALVDDAGGRFAINSATGAITVANGTLLDYETAHSHQITVRTIDQGGLALDKNFTIAVGDVFERVQADFNGDGRSDVLWRFDSGMVALWNNGTPAGGHVIADPGPGANWHIVGTGDFDGNGKADILWQADDGTVALWDNGTPGHVVAGPGALAGWHFAAVGDFDGNRHTDILWQNDAGAVAVWDNGVPAGGRMIADSGPAGWHIAAVGDFDGNGRDDVLWQSDSGAVAVWDNGTPAGGRMIADSTAAGWHIAGVGDFDGNHHDDVLWRSDSGAVAVWDNGTPAGGRMIADSAGAGWHLAQVGDFDGNGKADILWRNDDGTVAIWDNGTPAGGRVVAGAGQVAATVENGIGGTANTDFYGNSGDNVFSYIGGHDTIDGGAGTDALDLSHYSGGHPVIINLNGHALNLWIADAAGNWQAYADATNVENGIGATTNTDFYGNSGDNVFSYIGGHDNIDGGAGTDTLDLSHYSGGRPVIINLNGHAQNLWIADAAGNWQAYADATNVENAIGASTNTDFYGNSGNNVFTAGAGNGFLMGFGGSDTFVFRGNFGHDVIDDFAADDLIQFDHTQFADFATILSHTADDGLGNTVITLDPSHSVTLDHILKASLVAGEFHIV
jgi:hypothetical protein